MKTTGRIKALTGWKQEFKSRGVLLDDTWFNVYGELEECNEKLKGISRGDKAEIEHKEGKTTIINIKKIEELAEPVRKELEAVKIKTLEQFSQEMANSLKIAKELLKEHYPDGFVNPDSIVSVGITLFKAYTWTKQIKSD